jgi:hypothetical protein
LVERMWLKEVFEESEESAAGDEEGVERKAVAVSDLGRVG